MALSALTIGTNIGLSGSLFSTPVSGISAGSEVRVMSGAARVGSVGLVFDRLPYGVTEISIREYGSDGSYRDTAFSIYGVSALDDRSVVLSALAKGQTDAQQRAAIAAGATAVAGLQSVGLGVVPNVIPTAGLAITGTPLAGVVGSGDVFAPSISGGKTPYTLSLSSGTLPGGRSISGLTVVGNYTTAGSFSYTLRATDNASATADLAVNVVVSAAPAVLNALTVSVASGNVGTSLNSTVTGLTSGSSLALTGAGAAGLSVSGSAISGTPTTVGAVNLVETLAGASNSPRTTSGVISIAAAAVTLAVLTVSNAAATVGTAFSSTINGLTSGSSIALTGAGAAGLTIGGAVISGTPTTAGAVNIVETLAGATNSPRTTSGSVAVTAASVTLSALTTSSTAFIAATAFSTAINNATTGSTVTATSSDGTTLTVSGSGTTRTLSGTFSTAGSPTVTLTETLSGATNSPKTSAISATVTASATLGTLTVSPTTATVSAAYSGTIAGKTSGSTVTATSSDGTTLTVSSGAVSGTFTTAGSPTITLVESLAGATGSPKTSTVGLTVTAALAITGTPGAATQNTAYSFTPTATGGTTPRTFALTGTLPTGLSFSTSTGAITGTPTAAGTTSGLNITVTDSATPTPASASLGAFSLVVSAAALPAFTYRSDATTASNAMATKGTTIPVGRKYQLNRLLARLDAVGALSVIQAASWSRLYLFANDTANGAELVNILNPGTGDGVIAGSPTFTTQRGYVFSAAGAGIRTGVTLSQIPQNNHHVHMWSGTGVTSSSNIDCGAIDSASNGVSLCAYNSGASAATARSSGQSITIPNGPNFAGGNKSTFIDRSSATAFDAGHVGYLFSPAVAATSAAPVTAPEFVFGAINNNGTIGTGSGRLIGAMLLCPSLTAAQSTEVSAAIQAYLDCVRFGEPNIIDRGYASPATYYDTIFLGTTLSSIVGAYTAARRRSGSVAIMGGERDYTIDHLGGMPANGLGWIDSYDLTSIGGVPRAIWTYLNSVRGTTNANNQQNMSIQPGIFSFGMRHMVDANRTGGSLPGQSIPIIMADRVTSVTFNAGTNLYTVTTGDGRTMTCLSFIDNTDSQESFTPLGVPYITGSEAAGTGLEAINGYRGAPGFVALKGHSGAAVRPDPYKTPGVASSGLLNYVTTPPTTTIGQPDAGTQSYIFRMDVTTDVSSGIPWPSTPPTNYDAANYEHIARVFALDSTIVGTDFLNAQPTDNGLGVALDLNNSQKFMSIDVPGSGTAWVAAQAGTKADREAVWKGVENYIRGLFYWVLYSGDSRIPASVQTYVGTLRLGGANYTSPGPNDKVNWMGEMYVRSCKRLSNTGYKMNGNDMTMTAGSTPRSIKTVAVSAYTVDNHIQTLVAYDDGNGAAIWCNGSYGNSSTVPAGGSTSPTNRTPVPIEAIIPDPSFAAGVGFSCATGPSATLIANSALRCEPTRAEIGQAQGEMACLRAETGAAFSALDYPTLRTRILGGGDAVTPVLPQTNGQ